MVLGAVAAVAAAVTGAAVPMPAFGFVSPGHWVYSTILKSAVHVDGATGSVDAAASVDAAPGAQVVQGDSSGYVVDTGKITVFGKSDLNVDGTMTAPSGEVPLAIEGAGGPYLVYRQAGRVTRLGDRPATILAGGPLADPVLAADGTMWLLRKDNGRVCELLPGAATVSTCPAEAPAGHEGALSLLSGHPNYVDTTVGTLYTVGDKGFGPAVSLGGPVGPHLKAADSDVAGRLALLDPDTHTLRMVDPNSPSTAPVVVQLPKGQYEGPTAGGSVVAVVDSSTNTVLTYDDQGNQRDHQVMPKEAGKPRLAKGDDDRVYVEGDKGTHVMVVGDDGAVDDVPLDQAPDQPSTQDPGGPGSPVAPNVPDKPVTPPDHDRDVRSQSPPPTHDQPPANDDSPTHDQPAPPQRQPQPPESPDPPVIPASPPGAPGGVSATAGQASATVRWSAASPNGSAVTGYHVTWKSSAGTGSRDVSGGSRSVTVSGLTNGTSYTFSVAAKNSAGRGAAASAKAVTPSGAAKAPVVSSLYDGDEGTALVSWQQPDLGGGTLVHYTVDATGMSQRTSTGTSMLFTSLPHNGQAVTFTVRAVTTSGGQTITGAPGSSTWPGDHGSQTSIAITRGPKNCPDHPDEPACAQMHVVMKGFAPNTRYAITPHSDNDVYDAGDDHETTDSQGSVTFDTFQYYRVGDTVWVTAKFDGNTVTSNRMQWTAS